MKIHCKTKLFKIGSWTILKLPKNVSAKLSSRGMIMIKGTINNFHFQTVLEPDGKGSHWFKIEKNILKATRTKTGDSVILTFEPVKEWSEPKIPSDLKNALIVDQKARALWTKITPMARWDWIRWIGSTKQLETRKKRINNTLTMLKSGKRRPCCFNRTLCTEPYVSNNGILLELTKSKQN